MFAGADTMYSMDAGLKQFGRYHSKHRTITQLRSMVGPQTPNPHCPSIGSMFCVLIRYVISYIGPHVADCGQK